MIGCNKVVLREYHIESDKIPQVFDGYKIAMISDLHDNQIGDKIKKLIKKEKPDIILCAGDMIVSNVKYMNRQYIAENIMLDLAKEYEIIYANGNHETKVKERTYKFGNYYNEYVSKLQNAGIKFVNNKKYVITKYNQKMIITGYESSLNYYKKATKQELLQSDLENVLGKADREFFNILIAHNPIYFETYAKSGYDLVLSGHVHGGIVRLPIVGGVCSPQVKFFPKYDRGLFEIDKSKMILGAGLGTHTIPLRFNNPPEIVIAKLKKLG